MAICRGCGEQLESEGAPCPVCRPLDLPDTPSFKAQGGEDVTDSETPQPSQPGRMEETGPVLGGAPAGTGPTPEEPPAGHTTPTPDDDYQARLEEAAKVFGSDAFTIKRIAGLKATNTPAALVLGMPTAGKTWLIQRMKMQLANHYTLLPPLAINETEIDSDAVQARDQAEYRREYLPAPAGADRPEQDGPPPARPSTAEEENARREEQAAGETGRSSAIVNHRFISRHDRFALIDIPGEQVTQLVNRNYSSLRGLLAALDYARVIIIALPADVVLLGNELAKHDDVRTLGKYRQMKEDVDAIDRFTNAVALIAAARSLMQHKRISVRWRDPSDPPDDFDLNITPDNVENHLMSKDFIPIGGIDGLDCPAFFALTKADKVLSTIDVLPDAAADPQDAPAFLVGNAAIRQSEEAPLLSRLYERSPLRLRSLLSRNTPWAKLHKLLFGQNNVVAQISNPPEMMKQVHPALFNRLTEYLPMSRFDLVAAFYGHTRSTLRKSDLASTPSIGVTELVEWLGSAHEPEQMEPRRAARLVFTKIYGGTDAPSRIFSKGRKLRFPWRIRFIPRGLLAQMFRKEWHIAQTLPPLLTLAAAAAMSWVTFDWMEPTHRFDDGATYEAFQHEVDAAQSGAGQSTIPALAALPSAQEAGGTLSTADSAMRRDLVWRLTGWSEDSARGSVAVPDLAIPTDAALTDTAGAASAASRQQQQEWVQGYVCALKGWGPYRGIIRKAVINGYGDCGTFTKLRLRSPAIETLEWAGYLALLAGWGLVGGAGAFTLWFLRTRRAYAWLYHSRVVTTRHGQHQPASDGSTA